MDQPEKIAHPVVIYYTKSPDGRADYVVIVLPAHSVCYYDHLRREWKASQKFRERSELEKARFRRMFRIPTNPFLRSP